jgi:hypothetical protein
MTFNEQPWSQRYQTMGDVAEGIFEEIAPLGKFVRFGFNRPPFKMARITEFIRHTPDYITGTGHLVEVMGCGRDNVLKVKLDKYDALKIWNKHAPVALFVWNSATQEYVLLQWSQLQTLYQKAKRKGVDEFDDGNQYVGIAWGDVDLVVPYER